MKRKISKYPVETFNKLTKDIRDKLKKIQEKSSFIPNVFLALVYRPDELRAFFNYHDVIMERNSNLTKAEKEEPLVLTEGSTVSLGNEAESNENYQWFQKNNGYWTLMVQTNVYTIFQFGSISLSSIVILQLTPGNITYSHPANDGLIDPDETFISPGEGIYFASTMSKTENPSLYSWEPKGTKGLKYDLLQIFDKRLTNIGIMSDDANYSYCVDADATQLQNLNKPELLVFKAVNLSKNYTISPIRNIHLDTQNFVYFPAQDRSTIGYEYQSNKLEISSTAYDTFQFFGGPATVSVKAPSDFTYTILDENGNKSEYTGSQDIPINN